MAASDAISLFQDFVPRKAQRRFLGYVSSWPMSEASGNALDAINSNNLVDNNTVTSGAGVIGTARLFTAANSEYFTLAHNSTIAQTTAFSFSLWINPAATGGTFTIMTKGGGSIYELRQINATLQFYTGSTAIYGTSGNVLTVSTWKHVAVVYDGAGAANADRLKIYVNAANQALTFTGTVPASITNGSSSLYVGIFDDGVSIPWGGLMQYLEYFLKPLSAYEVTALYNAGTPLVL